MFHTPAHKVAPSLPQAGSIEFRPYADDPRVIVNQPEPDVLVKSHGTIVLLAPISEGGEDWLKTNLSHAQRFARSYAVEPRYVNDIVAGMIDDGLKVA